MVKYILDKCDNTLLEEIESLFGGYSSIQSLTLGLTWTNLI